MSSCYGGGIGPSNKRNTSKRENRDEKEEEDGDKEEEEEEESNETPRSLNTPELTHQQTNKPTQQMIYHSKLNSRFLAVTFFSLFSKI